MYELVKPVEPGKPVKLCNQQISHQIVTKSYLLNSSSLRYTVVCTNTLYVLVLYVLGILFVTITLH